MKEIRPNNFQKKLYSWHSTISRPMPWKGTKDPYKIWLSEIILQQTRVVQGIKYYNTFVSTYPTIEHLAKASEDEILSLWKGLGYYSRARNLKKAAIEVVTKFGGIFPRNYDEVLSLPGIGPYTASAICSFAYNSPYSVVDGNVYRVLSRVLGITIPIDQSDGKKYFTQKAQEYLDLNNPGKYNQSIMDFGALQCLPQSPKCTSCPFINNCTAFKNQSTNTLPIKSKKIKVRRRTFNFLIIQKDNQFLMEKRLQKDIWKGLYQPLLIENEIVRKDLSSIKGNSSIPNLYLDNLDLIQVKTQRLTHQLIEGRFYRVSSDHGAFSGVWKSIPEILALGLPKIVSEFFEEYTVSEKHN